MKELNAIIKAHDEAQASGKKTALATVVMVDGSSYRRAGARMLVTEDGQLTGAISGGCLEGDALRKARLVMTQQKAMLVTYDTTDDDDTKLGVGLGCNGIIRILIEPIVTRHPANPIALFRAVLALREPVVLITVFNLEDRHQEQYGTCLLFEQNSKVTGELAQVILLDELLKDANRVLESADAEKKNYLYINGYTCFVELLEPALSLVIVGAGNDVLPLVQMTKVLGWKVTLVDGRANYVTRERFPMADQLIIARPEEVLGKVGTDTRTVFALMTHNYNYDLALLTQLMPLALPYIGVLGPKKRLERMLAEMDAATGAGLHGENLHGPAGLDIGTENAEEIALSILAEIQSVIKRRDASPLKDKTVVHERTQFVRSIAKYAH